MQPDLPINAVLPDLLATLASRNCAVLIAPPGAGKTTAVAPALIKAEWCQGTVIVLSPRRVAARAAAERMAEMLGEKPGETIGYQTRMDSRTGPKTRVIVMTEAIFVSRILTDQELPGVAAVLFDEAHERNLDSDLGLALALETQSILREDLRLLVMSATIDGARFAELMGDDAPVIESEGKAHPLQIEWLGASPEKRMEDAMTSAILKAWREEEGDILAFLPGVGEIGRVLERLEDRLNTVPILPLHGQVQPQEQRLAIRRDKEGRRRIVLATSIAETSITLDGVCVVVDCGMSRRAEYDVAAGVTHLVTRRSSQASAGQRAGRAARQGPGTAYRLWEEGGHAGREAFDPPEILQADLANMTLQLARAGMRNPADLPWLTPPPAPALSAARSRLTGIGALDESGAISVFGKSIAKLPMDPFQAAMVVIGAREGLAQDASKLAILLQERGLGGRSEDLSQRMSRWDSDRSNKAEQARRLASGWADMARKNWAVQRSGEMPLAGVMARAMPDNIAKRRDKSGENWLSAGGRGYVLDPASPLTTAEWLVIGDAQGSAKGARISAALALESCEVEQYLADMIEKRHTARWNASEKRVEARLEQRLGAITLKSGPDPDPDHLALVDLLVDKFVENPEALLPAELIARARYARIAALSRESLIDEAGDWLAPLLDGRRDLKLPKGAVLDALLARLSWDERQQLDRLAPREFSSPAGTTHKIDYAGDDAPCVEVRVQALFGLERHPMIGDTPLLLKLTSPAGRPIQSTRDLPQFWRGSWDDVRKDMKGRYPKHRWPDEPWAEKPSLKTKNAFNS